MGSTRDLQELLLWQLKSTEDLDESLVGSSDPGSRVWDRYALASAVKKLRAGKLSFTVTEKRAVRETLRVAYWAYRRASDISFSFPMEDRSLCEKMSDDGRLQATYGKARAQAVALGLLRSQEAGEEDIARGSFLAHDREGIPEEDKVELLIDHLDVFGDEGRG